MKLLIIIFINQINQLHLSNNETSHHYIYVNNTHREKLCFTQLIQEFIEREAWLRHRFFIC